MKKAEAVDQAWEAMTAAMIGRRRTGARGNTPEPPVTSAEMEVGDEPHTTPGDSAEKVRDASGLGIRPGQEGFGRTRPAG